VWSGLRNFQAKFILALLFLKHLVVWVLRFWIKREGLNRFLKQYSDDGITFVTQKERNHFPHYQRCQICSFCTFSCRAILDGRAPSDFEPKFILLGFGRSSHEAELANEKWFPCVNCQGCTVECPNDVPIHAMASLLVERRNRLNATS